MERLDCSMPVVGDRTAKLMLLILFNSDSEHRSYTFPVTGFERTDIMSDASLASDISSFVVEWCVYRSTDPVHSKAPA